MYTSIYEAIQASCDQGQIFQFEPEVQPELALGPPRTMYVSYEINDLLCSTDERWTVHVAAILAQFAEHQMLRIRREGRLRYADRGLPADIVPLEPDPYGPREIWEIRSVEPEPSIRLFGSFAAPDYFISLTWRERNALRTQGQWVEAMRDCADLWHTLFFPCQPYSGEYPNAYLSNTEFVPS